MRRERFGSVAAGGLVEPVEGTEPQSLRELLTGAHGMPKRLQGHVGLDSFLRAVADLCALHASMHDDEPDTTAAGRRDALVALEAAAHRMQNGLAPLRQGSDTPEVFEALEPMYRYLAQRARDPQSEGRPVVPAIPATVPAKLAELLTLIDDGLAALRATCGHVASKIQPRASVEKDRERALARDVALAHESAFGELPPAGGWFRDFMAELGERMKCGRIGHKVVKQAVESLKDEGAPLPD